MEIAGLQEMNLNPELSWVQEHSLYTLNLLHTVLLNMTQRLQAAGLDVSVKTGGKKPVTNNISVQGSALQK